MISIIIPTYNRANLMSGTLNSLLAQSYLNWECIIVDDGSTDDTEHLLRTYASRDKRIKYYKRPDKMEKGPGSCRNYGFSKIVGDYIHFMDSDDEYFPEALRMYMKSFTKGVEVAVAEVQIIDASTGKPFKRSKIHSSNLIEDYLQGKISFYISGPLWRREFLEKQQQLFDPEIRNLDDWDFNLRMLYNDPAIKYILTPLIKYRKHGHSLSSDIDRLCLEEIKSEFTARNKHVHLLRKNKKADPVILQVFIKNRSKYFLRKALVRKSRIRFYLLRKLMIIQFELKDFNGLMRTIIGSLSFILSNKGYKFFKE